MSDTVDEGNNSGEQKEERGLPHLETQEETAQVQEEVVVVKEKGAKE